MAASPGDETGYSYMKPKHAALQRTIGYQFQEPALLVRALTTEALVQIIMNVLSSLAMGL